jgi:hypothetical protein
MPGRPLPPIVVVEFTPREFAALRYLIGCVLYDDFSMLSVEAARELDKKVRDAYGVLGKEEIDSFKAWLTHTPTNPYPKIGP